MLRVAVRLSVAVLKVRFDTIRNGAPAGAAVLNEDRDPVRTRRWPMVADQMTKVHCDVTLTHQRGSSDVRCRRMDPPMGLALIRVGEALPPAESARNESSAEVHRIAIRADRCSTRIGMRPSAAADRSDDLAERRRLLWEAGS